MRMSDWSSDVGSSDLRVEHLRGQDRKDLVEEIGSQRGAQRLSIRSRTMNDDSLRGEQAVQPLPFGLLLVDEAVHLGLDLGELVWRRAAVGRGVVDSLKLLAVEARGADPEEYDELAARGRQERQIGRWRCRERG